MIERLRRQFIIIAMSSLMLIILILIGIINALNMYHIENRTDGAINMIADNDGEFPDFVRHTPIARRSELGFQFTPETVFETRYFTAVIAENGTLASLNTGHIAAMNADEMAVYARDIILSGKKEGYIDNYKYTIIDKPEGKMLVVLDCRIQLQQAKVIFIISCAAAALSLAAMFVLVSVLSKRALKPVRLSLEKQKQFITDAGHELKTPLAIISSNADVLEIMNGETEWLKSIRNQTARLDDLIKNLLELSKLEERKDVKTWANFCVSNLIEEIVSDFKPMANSQKKTIACETLSDSIIHGNEGEIRQMLQILIDNAVKYADSPGVIQIKLYERGKNAVFEIRNSLCSPLECDPGRLFDRFFRAESSRSRENGGYGIGLSIAKSIAESHNGDIVAYYEKENKVICFHVYLPKYNKR